MKTLINKANPAIRIIAPEITEIQKSDIGAGWIRQAAYSIGEGYYFLKSDWNLVEDEQTIKRGSK